MPIYDYKCNHGHTFKEIVSLEADNPNCPECQGETERVFPVNANLRFGSDPHDKAFREMEANGEL